MANLITEKQKKSIKIDYLIRFITVFLFLISLLGAFLLAYTIPYYMSVRAKDFRVAEQFENFIISENKENVGENFLQIVGQINDKLKIMDFFYRPYSPSGYFTKILEKKNSSINITQLSFNESSEKELLLLIGGLSKSREALVSFIDELKTINDFSNINYPISDFAEDKNIHFTLNIIIKI